MSRARVHLAVRPGTRSRVACGFIPSIPNQRTHIPARVTCQKCKGTLAMADAELRGTTIPRSERPTN